MGAALVDISLHSQTLMMPFRTGSMMEFRALESKGQWFKFNLGSIVVQPWQIMNYTYFRNSGPSTIYKKSGIRREHGQWTCDESFFSKIFQIIGRFGRMGRINCGVLGYFQSNYQHTFCHCVFLVHDFSLINHHFYKKPKILSHIYLEYEVGQQKVRHLAIMRPLSVIEISMLSE